MRTQRGRQYFRALDFSSSSAAAFDIEIIAKKISALLGINIGDGTVHSQPRMSGL
nr:hypothetical protein KV8917_30020 [Klebsiella variicola]